VDCRFSSACIVGKGVGGGGGGGGVLGGGGGGLLFFTLMNAVLVGLGADQRASTAVLGMARDSKTRELST